MRSLLILFLLSCFLKVSAQNGVEPLSASYMDSLVHASLKAFDVPGIAVGIVKDGKLIFAHGYGVRSLKSNLPMDENTLFGIASNSKAFTTTLLGILVDEGKIHWEDKVRDYIPEFKLYSPFVTEEFTLKDLLCHRSGMGLGAGDLMFWPDSTQFSTEDVIHNLRYLKSTTSFRTHYDYDNLLYMVAGEVIHRVTGKSWDDFVSERIFLPLGMQKSASCFENLKDNSNVIDAHSKFDGRVQVVSRSNSKLDHAAGGIYSNITDLSKWVIMHMNEGVYGSAGQTLISKTNHRELWTPQTIIPVRNPGPYNTHFSSYGLGFFLSDVKGYFEATHTGGLQGMVTEITMIPELKLGIIVLTNAEEGGAFRSITNQIKDHYLGVQGNKWVERYAGLRQNAVSNDQNRVDQVWKKSDSLSKIPGKSKSLQNYLGTFTDNWMGDIRIHLENGAYRMEFKKSPQLRGKLYPYLGNSALVKWDLHSLAADAYLVFNLDENGKAVSLNMKPISSLTDFSFDFQDLNFTLKERN